MADVFVSYASEDRDRIAPLVEAIEAQGLSVWWDRRIDMGSSFDREIERELEAAKCVVVVWSAQSVDSDWVRNEAQDGYERNILVPLRIDEIRPPLAFRRAQTADLVGWPESAAELSPLIESITRSVGSDSTPVRVSQAQPHSTRNSFHLRRDVQIAVALLLLFGLGWWYWEEPVAPGGADVGPGSGGSAIAVLPFENMSNDPEQEFFSDGIAGDILNDLAKNSALVVRPRSSSFALKGLNLDAQTIGERLNVTHVLEGSVRRSSGRIRVTAQLSEVKTNRSVWSDRYDREMTDIFEVQDEITAEILLALNAELGTRTRRRFVSTEAYEAHQRGRHHMMRDEFGPAMNWLEKATELDPSNADAWADRARVLSILTFGALPNSGEHLKRRRDYIEKALTIDPAQANALGLRAMMDTFFIDRDYQTSIDQLVGLVVANPNSEEPHIYLSFVLGAVGRSELTRRVARRTVEIAPLSRTAMQPEIATLLRHGRIGEARQRLEEFSNLGMKDNLAQLAELAIAERDIGALQSVVSRPDEEWTRRSYRIWYSAFIPYLEGDFARARAIVLPLKSLSQNQTLVWQHRIALVERDFDSALEFYAQALAAAEPQPMLQARRNYVMRQVFPEFYNDARYEELLAKFALDPISTKEIVVPELPF